MTARNQLGALFSVVFFGHVAYSQSPSVEAEKHYKRGLAAFERRAFDDAITSYTRALELRPTFPDILLKRALAYVEIADISKALADLDKVIRLTPRNPAAYKLRARAYTELGRHLQALADIRKTIELRPDDDEAFVQRAELLLLWGKWQEAMADCKAALVLNPKNVCAYVTRGSILDDRADFKGALEELFKACEIDSSDGYAFSSRGMFLFRRGQNRDAIKDLSRAIALAPRQAVYYSQRSEIYRQEKQIDKAILDISRAITLQPADPVYYEQRAVTYHDGKQYTEALADVDKAIQIACSGSSPCPPGCYFLRGTLRMERKEYETAITDFSRVIELDLTSVVAAYAVRAYCYRQIGDERNAEKDEKAVREPKKRRDAEKRRSGKPRISTVAGTGQAGYAGDGAAAVKALLRQPFHCDLDGEGSLYIAEADNHVIRKVDLKTGLISTVAGTGKKGYTGDGGPAREATFNEPYAVVVDEKGNLYICDRLNAVIRKLDAATGKIATIAGTGKKGYGGDGGPGTKAQLVEPNDVCLDGRGGLLIADVGDWRIRRLDLDTGSISTFAGIGRAKIKIRTKLDRAALGDGGPATKAVIAGARAVGVDGRGNTYICEREGSSIRKVDAGGIITTVAGNGLWGYQGDGGAAKDAIFAGPKGIRCDRAGNVYVVDCENHAIRKIDVATNKVATIAGGRKGPGGDGAAATEAGLDRPHGCVIDVDGTVYIADTLNHRVRRVRP